MRSGEGCRGREAEKERRCLMRANLISGNGCAVDKTTTAAKTFPLATAGLIAVPLFYGHLGGLRRAAPRHAAPYSTPHRTRYTTIDSAFQTCKRRAPPCRPCAAKLDEKDREGMLSLPAQLYTVPHSHTLKTSKARRPY